MEEIIYCEKCGTVMINPYDEDDLCMGMTCPNCGWGWVTTNQNHILFDQQDYTLSMSSIEKPSVDIIRQVSQSLECNFIEARQKLQEKPVHLVCKAIAARDIARKLKELDIPFTITPDFPHKI